MSRGFRDRPRRVLIARLSAIGDTILTTPLLAAIKDAMPDVEVDWVVEPKSRPVLEMADGLSRIYTFPRLLRISQILRAPGRLPALLRDLGRLRREMAARRYDLCFDVQGLLKSGVATEVSGALWKVGWRRSQVREMSWMLTSDRLTMPGGVHVVDAWLSMLRVIGLPKTPVRFPLRPPHAALAEARRYIESLNLRGPAVIVHVGASRPEKCWPTERYAEVARMAAESRGACSIFTWGSDREREAAEAAVGEAGPSAVVAPPTDFALLAAIIRNADAFVGGDTGPMHLSVALGTPVVAVFDARSRRQPGPYGPGNIIIGPPLSAGGSNPLDAIEPPEVYTGLTEILGREPGESRRDSALADAGGRADA